MKFVGGPLDGLDCPAGAMPDGECLMMPYTENIANVLEGKPRVPAASPQSAAVYEVVTVDGVQQMRFLESISPIEYARRLRQN